MAFAPGFKKQLATLQPALEIAGAEDPEFVECLQQAANGDETAISDVITTLLDHRDPRVRMAGLQLAAPSVDPDLLKMVRSMLMDSEEGIQSSALRFCLEREDVSPQVLQALKGLSGERLGEAISAITGDVSEKPAWQTFLKGVLESEDIPAVLAAMAFVSGGAPRGDYVEIVCRRLQHPKLASAAMEALSEWVSQGESPVNDALADKAVRERVLDIATDAPTAANLLHALRLAGEWSEPPMSDKHLNLLKLAAVSEGLHTRIEALFFSVSNAHEDFGYEAKTRAELEKIMIHLATDKAVYAAFADRSLPQWVEWFQKIVTAGTTSSTEDD